MKLRHFLQFKDFTRAEHEYVFARTKWIKAKFKKYQRYWPLEDRTLAMIFEKPSTRTRMSFEAGMHQLGGAAIYLFTRDSQLGRGEPVEDAAQVISRMCDVIMVRTFEQDIIERFAANSRVPVINGLTNEYHPCQILADVYTFIEHRGPIKGKTVAWVGDSNNVMASWIHAAKQFDFELRIATPRQLAPRPELARWARESRAAIFIGRDPAAAAKGASCIVTDTWLSMGDKHAAQRRKLLKPFQVNTKLMEMARPDAIFMHCLPAHRGEEVTAEVIDGPQSVVFDEAENRLHAQKGILAWCLRADAR
jgi:ornithine carbamoyltransferase